MKKEPNQPTPDGASARLIFLPMPARLKAIFLAGFVMLCGVRCFAASEKEHTPLKFFEAEYFFRWSKADQREYTPGGQENLERLADMVTLNYYRSVHDGEALANTANAVLETYKSAGARVLRTNSVPRTPTKPAEYLVAVLFPRPEFIEAVFTRFKIVDGVGTAMTYSHREYGKKIGDQMSAWLQKNGPPAEKALMSFEPIPSREAAAR